jgi:hypothetical protein
MVCCESFFSGHCMHSMRERQSGGRAASAGVSSRLHRCSSKIFIILRLINIIAYKRVPGKSERGLRLLGARFTSPTEAVHLALHGAHHHRGHDEGG